MLQVSIDDDPHVDCSENIRAYRALQFRGLADASAGRSCQSEHSIYATTFQNADRIERIDRGEVIACVEEVVACARCSAVFTLDATCGCLVGSPASNVPGMLVIYGQHSAGEGYVFRSYEHLRVLIAGGGRIETLTGEDVTHHVSPLQ